MGLRDMFSGRRSKEAAIPQAWNEVEGAGADHHVDLGNLGGMAGIAQMMQAAQKQGNVTVSQGQMGMIDARGQSDELRNAIMKTLSEHGVDAQRGQQIQVTDPALMQALFKTIAEHQGEMGAMQAQAMQAFSQMAQSGQMGQMGAGTTPGGTTNPMPSPQIGVPSDVGALEKLDALRKSGALTDAEFEAEKQKLLGG